MIEGFEHVGTDHKCNVCSCDFTDDEGGIQGHFGILPRQWYLANQNEITWFLIGFLIAAAVHSFSVGEYDDAAFSLLMAFASYYLNKK